MNVVWLQYKQSEQCVINIDCTGFIFQNSFTKLLSNRQSMGGIYCPVVIFFVGH